MSVDLSKIKAGDRVTVLAKVEDIGCHSIRLRAEDGMGHWRFSVTPEAIATHTPAPPKPLEPGEEIVFVGIHGERNPRGKIIHIHGDLAWVDWRGSFPHPVLGTGKLERLDPPSQGGAA